MEDLYTRNFQWLTIRFINDNFFFIFFLSSEGFGVIVNDSFVSDRGSTHVRYTSRYFLKHSSIEQAFDALLDAGFYLGGCCGTGTATASSGMFKPACFFSDHTFFYYYPLLFLCLFFLFIIILSNVTDTYFNSP